MIETKDLTHVRFCRTNVFSISGELITDLTLGPRLGFQVHCLSGVADAQTMHRAIKSYAAQNQRDGEVDGLPVGASIFRVTFPIPPGCLSTEHALVALAECGAKMFGCVLQALRT